MSKSLKLYVAVDVDFVLALTGGEDFCAEAVDIVTKLGGHVFVTPSVLLELEDQRLNQVEAAFRNLAEKALKGLNHFGIHLAELDDVDTGIAKSLAQKLLEKGYCEDPQCAMILAEACTENCRMILTYRAPHVRGKADEMKLLMIGEGVEDCTPVPPNVFVEFFRPAGANVPTAGASS